MLLAGTRLHAGILIVLVAAVLAHLFLWRRTNGFRLRVVGLNPRAAENAGIDVRGTILFGFLICGALAGLAGFSEVAGVQRRMIENLSPGFGYTAIIVALLGQTNPFGVLAAAFLFAALQIGASTMESAAGVPSHPDDRHPGPRRAVPDRPRRPAALARLVGRPLRAEGLIMLAILTDPTFVGFLSASMRLAIPIMLAALGGLFAERSGVLNIGLEGMMLVGAFVGFVAAYGSGHSARRLPRHPGRRALPASILGFYTITLGANQVVVGIAINLLAVGVTSFFYRLIFGVGHRPATDRCLRAARSWAARQYPGHRAAAVSPGCAGLCRAWCWSSSHGS